MNNITMCVPTKILFGKGQLQNLPEPMAAYGKKVLFVYGGGSIKRTGLYDQVTAMLQNNGFTFWELPGVQPNPKVDLVRKGIAMCREHGIEVVLAVGGGSCFDCGKAIAAGVNYDGDVWDFAVGKANPGSVKVLPVVVVTTIAATGSEMDTSAVISNPETNEKLGFSTADMRPRIAVLDPENLFTLPRNQTAAGVTDIISHVFEYYFNNDPTAYYQNRHCEAMLKTAFHYGHIAYDEPENYNARANLLLTSVWALTGVIGKGFDIMWSSHMIEHEVSAYYDITHGVGLAVITIPWLRYCAQFESTMPKFREYAVNVWGVDPEGKTDKQLAEIGIEKTAEYLKYMDMPSRFSQIEGVEITDEHFGEMADHIMNTFGAAMNNCFVPLNRANIVEILNNCL